jgi:hypothetical protein
LVPGGGCFHQDNKKCGRVDPLNLRPQAARLETRRNFVSNRVVEAWNLIPGDIKRSKTVSSFKNAYRSHRDKMVENA